MARYRWLNAEWQITILDLAAKLKKKPFSSEVKHGFVIDRIRDYYLEARYIERIEYTDSTVDPFGKEFFFDRVEFRKSTFRISTTQPTIELRESPRSVQPLINQLSELVDFQLSISTDPVDVLSWAERIQGLVTRASLIDSVQISSLYLADDVAAKMIIKGGVDVRKAYLNLTQNKNYKLEKVQLRFDGMSRGSIVLGSAGTANLEIDDPRHELIDAVRLALSEQRF